MRKDMVKEMKNDFEEDRKKLKQVYKQSTQYSFLAKQILRVSAHLQFIVLFY